MLATNLNNIASKIDEGHNFKKILEFQNCNIKAKVVLPAWLRSIIFIKQKKKDFILFSTQILS